MRAKHTGYAVPGWGVGELWTSDVAVLAHEFRFAAEAGAAGVTGARALRTGDLGAGTGYPSAIPRRPGPGGQFVDAAAPARDAISLSADPSAAPNAAHLEAAPLEGAPSPPTGTVTRASSRLGHAFVSSPSQPERPPPPAPPPPMPVDPDELADRFTDFLGGAAVAFDDVPLDLEGVTAFQLAVAHALRAIPRGEIVSYAELAALAGYPRAQRAVGTFCARNRFMFLLPCHRVVGTTGLGGYGSAGTAVKRRLLGLEGVAV